MNKLKKLGLESILSLKENILNNKKAPRIKLKEKMDNNLVNSMVSLTYCWAFKAELSLDQYRSYKKCLRERNFELEYDETYNIYFIKLFSKIDNKIVDLESVKSMFCFEEFPNYNIDLDKEISIIENIFKGTDLKEKGIYKIDKILF